MSDERCTCDDRTANITSSDGEEYVVYLKDFVKQPLAVQRALDSAAYHARFLTLEEGREFWAIAEMGPEAALASPRFLELAAKAGLAP